MEKPKQNKERERAVSKIRNAIMFWRSFYQYGKLNWHTRETTEITIECLNYVARKIESGELPVIFHEKEKKDDGAEKRHTRT